MDDLTSTMAGGFRAAPPILDVAAQLGDLKDFPGTWVGHGFNLVALPNGQNNNTPLPFPDSPARVELLVNGHQAIRITNRSRW